MTEIPRENHSIYLIAGEASGDTLGAGLMASLREQLNGKVVFYGIGGEKMEAEGLRSLFPFHELSLMGFVEIIPHALKLLARMNMVMEDIIMKQPDVLVTIDSPGFCYRIAKRVKKSGKCPDTKLVHYVAPTVWAYKPERAKKFARVFDHMLALLPFEPPFFESEGLPTTFVGHPSVCAPVGDGKGFRQAHNIPDDLPLICLLPGSRHTELKRHLPIFARAMMLLAPQMKTIPGIVIPVPSFLLPDVAETFEHCPMPAIIVGDEKEKRDAIAASNVALVKSGTVSLEVAMAGVPMIVSYRTNPITAEIVRAMIRIRHVTLLNIMLQREVIPELIQEQCQAPHLAEALSALMSRKKNQEKQLIECKKALEQMRPPKGLPHDNAAEKLISLCRPV